MLVQKPSTVIADLGIIPRSISKVGDHFVGHSARAAYVWHRGEITEIVPGDRIALESISADAVERVSGMHFAGTRDDNKSVFMSNSSAFDVVLLPKKPEAISFDMKSALQAARDYAASSSHVYSVLEICSESAAPKYLKYVGKSIHIEDASDEYDLEIEKGDFIKLVYLNKDRYDLRLKDSPRIQFIIRGHEIAQNIMSGLEFSAPFGQISDQKTDKFEYVGTVKKKLFTPHVAKDTVVLTKRKKHYFAHNLAVPIESWMNAPTLKDVMNNLKVDPEAPSYVKGKAVRVAPKVAPMGQAAKLPKLENPEKVTGQKSPRNIKTVYGAFFPVSPSTPNRSRIVFEDSPAKLATTVNSIIAAYSSPVDYTTFSALSTDENYQKASKNKVVIKTTPILKTLYGNGTTVKMSVPTVKPTFVEPKADAPELHIPAIASKTDSLYDFFRRLIEEGYFNTGVRLAMVQQTTGIRFSAPVMDDTVYDQVVGVARRISSYMLHNGVPLTKGNVTIARGKRAAEIRFKLPVPSKEGQESIDRLRTDHPSFDTPVYETIRPKQPTVEITALNIHTGKVTCRAQRGPALYGAPFDTYYSLVKRKIFAK